MATKESVLHDSGSESSSIEFLRADKSGGLEYIDLEIAALPANAWAYLEEGDEDWVQIQPQDIASADKLKDGRSVIYYLYDTRAKDLFGKGVRPATSDSTPPTFATVSFQPQVIYSPFAEQDLQYRYTDPTPGSEPSLVQAENTPQVFYASVNGRLFIDDPKAKDVNQGIGTCYLLATLAALANCDWGKNFLRLLIREESGGYFVKLREGIIRVSSLCPVRRAHSRLEFAYALCGRPASDQFGAFPFATSEDALSMGASAACATSASYSISGPQILDNKTIPLWSLLIEKAYAIQKSGYHQIVGGQSHEAFQILGIDTEVLKVRCMPHQKIREFFLRHRLNPIVAGTVFGYGKSVQRFNGREGVWTYELEVPVQHGRLCVTFEDDVCLAEVDVRSGVHEIKCGGISVGSCKNDQFKVNPWLDPTLIQVEFQVENPKSDRLSSGHQWAVISSDDSGVVLWDTDIAPCGQEIRVTYDEISLHFSRVSAGMPR